MVQALAFAEMLAGGLFIVSAIQKIPLGELLKHGLSGAKAGTSSTTSQSGGSPGGTGGGSGSPGIASTGVPGHSAPTGPTAPPPGAAFFEEEKKKLEHYLGRPLTPKETKELHTITGQ
jgi:hypothetical protein